MTGTGTRLSQVWMLQTYNKNISICFSPSRILKVNVKKKVSKPGYFLMCCNNCTCTAIWRLAHSSNESYVTSVALCLNIGGNKHGSDYRMVLSVASATVGFPCRSCRMLLLMTEMKMESLRTKGVNPKSWWKLTTLKRYCAMCIKIQVDTLFVLFIILNTRWFKKDTYSR